jgi:hypothetical protein
MLKRRYRHNTFGGFVHIARDWLAILWLIGPVYFQSTVSVSKYLRNNPGLLSLQYNKRGHQPLRRC